MDHDVQLLDAALCRDDFGDLAAALGRRSEPRIRADRQITVMRLGRIEGLQFKPARLIDCSPNVIAILHNCAMAPEEQFMVRAKLSQVVMLLYSVRHCASFEGAFRVGARFQSVIGPADDRDPQTVLNALLSG
jgi:hypothetical protein